MSKKRNTSSGQSAEPQVDAIVNRFNVLNDIADLTDSDTEDVQHTKRAGKKVKEPVNKPVDNDVESGSEDDDKHINNSKKSSLVDDDGFQTVRSSKTKKPKQPVKIEKVNSKTRDTQDKNTAVKVRSVKQERRINPENVVTENHTDKRISRKVIKDIPKEDIEEEIEQINAENVEVSGDKKAIYVPPVSVDGWTTQTRRRRFDRSDKAERTDNPENNENPEEDSEANKMEHYNPGVRLHGDEMKLNTSWTVWIHENDNQDWSLSSYKSIYEINSIGSMWRFLWVLDNLNKNVRQYYIMRNGITPIWEDNNNKQGAICSIMIDNMNRSSRHTRGDLGVDAFSAICILVMNESFVKNNQDINGLCYSIKSRSVLIKLWIKDYESNANFIDKLPITILKSLDSIISNMENRGHLMRSNGKSKVSVQIKQIKPNY